MLTSLAALQEVLLFLLVQLIILLKDVFILWILNQIPTLLMSVGQIVKQPCVEELVHSLAVVAEDHLEQLTDARLDHGWVNWVVCLNENSVYWEEQVL